jgi:4-oxalocrotonate tautomerase
VKDFFKEEVVDKINQILLETWGCPQEALTISVEEVVPDESNEKVKNPEIDTKLGKMMVLDGKKKY